MSDILYFLTQITNLTLYHFNVIYDWELIRFSVNFATMLKISCIS